MEIHTVNDDVWKKKNVQNNIPNMMTDQSVAQLCLISFFSEQKKSALVV